ncbi:TonB-dependent receptor [Reichenbachiella sp. MSK19-1]|uniref:SusC/RagA family TonB-linked outer membrane protein n=1 Tax=Reichenbachiella sp. MSK19-1 TaxID=1897631 RepID=UPI000E6CED7F|nr:TonB-dependent receptor [Reichenbachiella sp. MSK19-1]RJE74596.1 SusC/RagA family protein [Reichenbachiella sp. MSK19-1]
MITRLSNYSYRLLKFYAISCLLVFGSLVAVAQDVKISGKVVEEGSGEPLPGVSILVKGTATGVVTDFDGAYSISVPADATLIYSFIGYLKQEVSVNGRSVVDVSLPLDVQALEEVVVVGYGAVQRKEAVTGSVASIGGDEMREVPSANITDALQGRLPGVDMTQTSSRPGATMQIRIRGTRSLSASNDPLVVLDGIPFAGSISDIDPNSIKSVDILKDASATAIYGSRGANGVILVTTKRGRKGQEAIVSYNAFHGVKTLFSDYPMMDGPEFATMRAEAIRTVDELGRGATYPNSSDEFDDINTDWQDLLYQTGKVMSHDVSVTKGSETGNYSFGLGYYKDEGVVPTNQYSRFSLRAAVDQNVGEYFRFGLTSNNSYGVTEGNQVGVADALGSSPLSSPYDDQGNLKRASQASQDIYKVWTKESIEDAQDVWLSETKTFGTYNNIYGEVEAPWVKGLKYRLNLGMNYRNSQGGSFTGIGVTSASDPNAPSSASISSAVTTSWVVENILSYDRTFAEKHSLNILALYSNQQEKYNSSRIVANDLPADHFQYYNLGYAEGEIIINPDEQNYSVWGLRSWMGRLMYAYDNRYMLSATLRSDGSSRLSPGNKWHTYPAVSAGWNIANESFMQGISQINMLKLRVGYGETSNQAIDPYSTLGRLGTRFYNFGDNGDESYSTGYILSELPNTDLGWEYTQTWNFGLDFGLFQGRLNGTVEYYKQHTKDILLSVDLPSTAGVGSFVSNVGETENKGIELSLSGVIIDNLDGFTWEAGFNLYGNRNELVSLTSGQEENVGNWWFVGQPINVIYDYKRTGLWQEGDEHMDILEPGGNPGMVKVEYTGEYNSDGTPVRPIGAEDRQVLNFNPDWQGGFNTRLSYKGIDLSIVGAFKKGGTVISTLYGTSSYLNLLSGRHNNVDVDYWTPENTDAKYPRPGGLTAGDNPKYGSTLAYFDASYLKIRTISLGYNFGGNWLDKAGISKLRVYATAQNPLVMFSPYHKESGMDPESNSYGDENQAVTTDIQERLPVIGTNAPATRTYLLGINLTF